MSKLSEMRGTTVAALILSGIGMVFLAAGVLVFVFFTRFADAERARVEALEPLDAIALSDVPKGRDVLLEGRIAAGQPRIFRDFVAYAREERQRDDKEGPDPWVTRRTETPALQLEVPEGTAQVTAQYSLGAVGHEWIDPQRYPETRYLGLVRGQPVVVLGTKVPDAVDATIVTPGTKASYLDSVASGRTVARWLGSGFIALGVILVVLAASVEMVGRRHTTAA